MSLPRKRSMMPEKPTVLLVAESVTLAHFARIVSLARSLDTATYEVVVATDPRYLSLEPALPFPVHEIWSIPSEQFTASLAKGKPLYDVATLKRYVEDDLALLERVQPDLVVGDFRLSLAVSAPLRQVPYAAIANAYWSPFADTDYPVPDLPITRALGVTVAQLLFDLVRPLAFRLDARSLNKTRQLYGLPSLGNDMRRVYSWGDFTLYPDVPDIFPTRNLPANHHYLGMVPWSTGTPLPDWWDELPDDKPIVFVTLGSSGQADLLPLVLDALGGLPLTVIAATLGSDAPCSLPPNVFFADYVPLDKGLELADGLICNGGSLTSYQALAHAVPVIGVAANLDQMLNMQAVEKLGAGICLRPGDVRGGKLSTAMGRLLETPSFAEEARQTASIISSYDYKRRFSDVIGAFFR